jgi:hypothetical protein
MKAKTSSKKTLASVDSLDQEMAKRQAAWEAEMSALAAERAALIKEARGEALSQVRAVVKQFGFTASELGVNRGKAGKAGKGAKGGVSGIRRERGPNSARARTLKIVLQELKAGEKGVDEIAVKLTDAGLVNMSLSAPLQGLRNILSSRKDLFAHGSGRGLWKLAAGASKSAEMKSAMA